MKEIIIAKGKNVAIIDDEDFDLISKYTWTRSIRSNKIYVVSKGVSRVLMHRLIMGFPKDLLVDHINHNGLDNRKINLRIVSKKQNQCNRRPSKKGTSKYLGVIKRRNSWRAQISINKRTKHIGTFASEEQAALAYNEFAKVVHGDYANLNII